MKSIKESFNLSNKISVITGGAGLLGKGHAEAIAEFGGIPILLDIDKSLGRECADNISRKYGVECKYIYCDVTNESQLLEIKKSLVDDYGKIDILINNAAINPKLEIKNGKNISRLENFSIDQWNLELSVGLTSSMLCCKIFGKEMAKNSGGVILNISSDLGIIAPDQRIYRDENLSESEQQVKPVTYSVIKHGIIGLTKYLATYWPGMVRCNALCPGGVYDGQSEEFVSKITKLIPMARMADKDEYKSVVLFMISDASAYMNGSVLSVDGGRSCW